MLHHHGEREPSTHQHGHEHNHHHGHGHGHKTHGCINDVPALVENLKWKENETVLDYGCGVGQNLMEFVFPIVQKNGSKVIGVDCAAEAIQRAKEKFPDNANLFLEGDIMTDDKWPLKDQRFDKVVAVHSLYMELGEFLTRIRKQLNEGGQIATSWPLPTSLDVAKILKNFPKYGPEFEAIIPDPLWLSDPEEVRRVIIAHGFSISFFEVIPHSHAFNSGDHFLRTFGGLCDTVTSKMTEEERAQLKEYMHKEVCQALNVPVDNTDPIVFHRQSLRLVMDKV